MTVNAEAPGVLGEEAQRAGALLVHYSTDYVFDGGSARPYRETDATRPLNVYGRSKVAGEAAIAASGASVLVLRATWLYSMRGHNFLRTILRLASEREELRIVDDQVGAPTWSRQIAEATALMVARMMSSPTEVGRVHPLSGTYHLTAAGQVSWCGFARAILDRVRDAEALRCRRVVGIPTADYPTPATRPLKSPIASGSNGRLVSACHHGSCSLISRCADQRLTRATRGVRSSGGLA